MLARTFQFGEAVPGDLRPVLPSPQAAIMKALVEGFMSQQPVAYILFGAGAMIALIMEMLGVPALIFALGMYLPLELNTPALVGGFLAHFLGKRSERRGRAGATAIRERGVVIASGLMAGGALGGVFGAALRLLPWYAEDRIKTPFYDNVPVSQTVSAVLFAGAVRLRLVALAERTSRRRPEGHRSVSIAGCRRHPRHRHPLGRRRDEPLGHRPLHRRLVVLRRAASARLHPPERRPPCARPGGVAAKKPDRRAIEAYLAAVDVRGAIRAVKAEARQMAGASRARTSHGLADCFEVMWDLAMEILGQGEPVPYERCVRASTGAPPEPSDPRAKRAAASPSCWAGRASRSSRRRAAGRGGRLAARSASSRASRSRPSATRSSPSSTP